MPSFFSDSGVFLSFLETGVDRLDFISTFLKERGVSCTKVSFSTGHHLLVTYKKNAYNRHSKEKIIVAHYDRLANTEGANDNSAACFILMNFAVYLSSLSYPHNIKIVFTDSEEAGKEGVAQQGAYKLALAFRKLMMMDSDIYIFDMCGRGDMLIFSLSGLYGRAVHKTSSLLALHNKATSYAKMIGCPYMSLLTAYSDNAGFVAAGLNAQLVTVLPREEAIKLKTYLDFNKDNKNNDGKLCNWSQKQKIIDVILRNERIEKTSNLEGIIPYTWQLMHTENDRLATLTDYSFELVMNYLKKLANKTEKY